MRVISFALTAAQIRARTKTETRRLGWEHVRVGDKLRGVLKSQGRRRDEPLVDLAIVEVVAVRRERLDLIDGAGLDAEGFPPVPGDTIEDRRARFVALFPIDGCDPVRVIVFRNIDDDVADRVLRLGHPIELVAADLDRVKLDRVKPGTIAAVRAAVARAKAREVRHDPQRCGERSMGGEPVKIGAAADAWRRLAEEGGKHDGR